MILFELIPGKLLVMFSASDYMMSIGKVALRICCISLIFGAANIILTSAMQAMDHSRYTLIINLMRQFIVLVPAFFLLSYITHDINKVWFAVPLAEMISAAVTLLFFRRMEKDLGLKFMEGA